MGQKRENNCKQIPPDPFRSQFDPESLDEQAGAQHIQGQFRKLLFIPFFPKSYTDHHITDRTDEHHGNQFAHQNQTRVHFLIILSSEACLSPQRRRVGNCFYSKSSIYSRNMIVITLKAVKKTS